MEMVGKLNFKKTNSSFSVFSKFEISQFSSQCLNVLTLIKYVWVHISNSRHNWKTVNYMLHRIIKTTSKTTAVHRKNCSSRVYFNKGGSKQYRISFPIVFQCVSLLGMLQAYVISVVWVIPYVYLRIALCLSLSIGYCVEWICFIFILI